MAATTGNTLPLWQGTVQLDSVVLTAAGISVNSSAPGTIGTNCFLACNNTTSPDGTYIQKLRFSLTSTTGIINVAATNINIFVSTITSGATSAADTFLYQTLQVPAQTIAAVTTAPIFYDVPLNLGLQAGRHILVSQTVAATSNTAWVCHCHGGKY